MLGIRGYLVGILVAAALAGRADANDIRYTITDLGVLSGAPSNGGSHPTAMNDVGQVCGYGDTTVATSSGLALADHAWLYTGSGSLVDVGAFGKPPDSFSIATAVNNSGMVCGYSDSSDPARSTRAFVYTQAGGMQDLPIFPGGQTVARDINNIGQIVGYATAADGTYRSFLYSTNGSLIELDPAHPPLLINDAGQVVAIAGSANYVGTYISNGGTGAWTNIGSLGGLRTQPDGLNRRGDIVGFSTKPGETIQGAFLYSGGTMTDLGSFGGSASEANGVNDFGVVVGGSDLVLNSASHAFVYYGSGTIQDLNDLVDPTLPWAIGNAFAVNNSGQIAAAGSLPGMPEHALLLTPVPEPSSFLLFCSAGFALILAMTGAGPIDSRRFHLSCQIRNRFQILMLGGSNHAQTSMAERCSRAPVDDCGHAARQEERPISTPHGKELSSTGEGVPGKKMGHH